MSSVLELVMVFAAVGVAAWLPRTFPSHARKQPRYAKPTPTLPAAGPAMDL
jgi:hypothetical protein